MQDFIVLDTEGKEFLRELAILDRHGNELYNVFVQEALSNTDTWRAKPLLTVLEEFFALARGKQVVCHYADHDREVLQQACQQAGILWEQLDFVCTYNLAKQEYPDINGHSLEYLCKHLDLHWDKRAYNRDVAHTARYDTQFTYLLYRKLKSEQLKQQLHGKPNPFGDSRVDNPFEYHVDMPKVYEHEFSRFTTILEEIKRDPNHQSKGALVIGEAGNGKTHLIMRLAHEVLKNNRLLFIRQPNHPETVIHHIYCRILESFMETVPNSEYSQLEFLLAHSFSRIVLEHFAKASVTASNKHELLLKRIDEDHLSIYKVLGKEGSDQYRNNWKFIEKHTTEWWTNQYGFSNYGCDVIKGLIKFCSYTEASKRDLVRKWLAGQEVDEDELKNIGLSNWSESMDREEFALQAIRVFSKLSIEDQPLIIVFDQLESLRDHENLLRSFGAALKQLFTEVSNSLIIVTLFPDRWKHFQHFFDSSITDRIAQNQIYLNRPSERELTEILAAKAVPYQIDIEELLMPEEVENIVKQNSIRAVLNVAADYYRLKADSVPLPVHARTFEERVLSDLQKLRDEIDKLKRTQKFVADPETTSTADVQILKYLEQQKTLLAARYTNSIISDGDDLGKLLFLVKAWNQFKAFKIDYLHLSKRALPEHLMLVFPKQEGCPEVKRLVGFLHAEGTSFTSRLKNLNELVVSYPQILFAIFRDARQPEIMGKVGKQEIDRFRNYDDSNRFITLKEEPRLLFEALYKTVVDIQNRDYNADLQTVFVSFFAANPEHWFSRFVT
ncbi:MAG: 3'-5' exonuclease [Thiotrichaceae bacterium]|nr:3'-5' exonuclease [Thiotrichaceae bacterium]